MAQKIVFVHGFGSNCQTDKKTKLDDFGYDVACVTVDHKNPKAVKTTLTNLVKKHIKEDPIVVGHSLGGLWAYYLAGKFGLKCVIINPALTPPPFISGNFDKDSLAELEKIREEAFSFTPTECIVIGELGDEILDHNHTAAQMKSRAKVMLFKGGDHRFKHFDDLKTALIDLKESYLEN